MAAASLVVILARMPDPRSPHGRFHPPSAVLGMVVLAMLQGRTSLTGIARFGRQHGKRADRRRQDDGGNRLRDHEPPGERGSATALLDIVRDHWEIENRLHHVRDVTLKEDACRVRTGSAPQVLAALRNAVVHLLADVRCRSRVEALEHLQIHPKLAQSLIGLQ